MEVFLHWSAHLCRIAFWFLVSFHLHRSCFTPIISQILHCTAYNRSSNLPPSECATSRQHIEAVIILSMLFQKKERTPQSDEVAFPIDGKAESQAADAPERPYEGYMAVKDLNAKDPGSVTTDIIYPSGLKLALLMTSIFISMFLVSLVRLIHHLCVLELSAIPFSTAYELIRVARRTSSSSQPPFPRSRTSSIQQERSVGTGQRI